MRLTIILVVLASIVAVDLLPLFVDAQ